MWEDDSLWLTEGRLIHSLAGTFWWTSLSGKRNWVGSLSNGRDSFSDLMCPWRLDPVWKVSGLMDPSAFCASGLFRREKRFYINRKKTMDTFRQKQSTKQNRIENTSPFPSLSLSLNLRSDATIRCRHHTIYVQSPSELCISAFIDSSSSLSFCGLINKIHKASQVISGS